MRDPQPRPGFAPARKQAEGEAVDPGHGPTEAHAVVDAVAADRRVNSGVEDLAERDQEEAEEGLRWLGGRGGKRAAAGGPPGGRCPELGDCFCF